MVTLTGECLECTLCVEVIFLKLEQHWTNRQLRKKSNELSWQTELIAAI